MDLRTLAARWREDAVLLRRYGQVAVAEVAELHARELEEALADREEETLTMAEASMESGYSERRLRELLASGSIPNAGRRGVPRIRRADLPRKPGASTAGDAYDPAADARSLLGKLRPAS